MHTQQQLIDKLLHTHSLPLTKYMQCKNTLELKGNFLSAACKHCTTSQKLPLLNLQQDYLKPT